MLYGNTIYEWKERNASHLSTDNPNVTSQQLELKHSGKNIEKKSRTQRIGHVLRMMEEPYFEEMESPHSFKCAAEFVFGRQVGMGNKK